jgi:DNA-binding NarL/FixJ family response regulator
VVIVPRLLEGQPDHRPSTDNPKILIVDREPLFQGALRALVCGPPIHAEVFVATRLAEAMEIAGSQPLDLIMCDLRAEPRGSTTLPAALAASFPGVRIILLAAQEDEALLASALLSGAAGFFTKDTPVDEFLEGVTAVLNGHYAVGRNLVQQTLARLGARRDVEESRELAVLSPAERAILGLIGQAQPVRTIAATRGISEKTVRNHLASIYRKLDLRNRTEAVLLAARVGLTGD